MADDNKSVIVGVIVGAIGAIVSGVTWCIGKSQGHAKGVDDGREIASKDYEQKLLKQAEEFVSERNQMAASAAKKDELIQKLIGLLEHEKDRKQRMNINLALSRVRAVPVRVA